jgi:hypothetical protein
MTFLMQVRGMGQAVPEPCPGGVRIPGDQRNQLKIGRRLTM